MHDDDAHLAAPPRDRRGNFFAGTVQQHIGFGITEPQTPHMQVIEKGGQHRLLEADLARLWSELQPEARLHQREDRGARPGLRRTATGYIVGPVRRLAKPQNNSGSRRGSQYEAALNIPVRIRSTGSLKP